MNNKNTAKAKGIRTFLQALPAFVVGLLVTLWIDPESRQIIVDYVRTAGPELLLLLGVNISVFSGLFAYGQNKVEDR